MPGYKCVLNNFIYNKVEIFVHHKRGDANPRNGRVSRIRLNTGAGRLTTTSDRGTVVSPIEGKGKESAGERMR